MQPHHCQFLQRNLVPGAKHFLLANISSHVPLVPISTFLDNLHVQYATVNVKKTKLMLSGSKCYRHLVTLHFPLVKTKWIAFHLLPTQEVLDEKWKWKMHVNSLLQKLGHRLSVFNRIYHMLDEKSLTAYFNGLVLPHLDYGEISLV